MYNDFPRETKAGVDGHLICCRIIGLYPRLQRLPLNRLLLVSLCLCDYGNTEKFAVSDTPCPVQNAKKEPESTGCNPVNSGSIVSLLGSVY
mgnify:FL=1